MRDDAVLGHALPLDRGLGPIRWRAVGNRDDGSEESEEVITKSRM